MKILGLGLSALFVLGACASPSKKSEAPQAIGYDAVLTTFAYPFPVKQFAFESQGQKLQMSYMDVPAQGSAKDSQTVVLFHGKNFGGFYFEKIAQDLSAAGYRVVIPDQIGFGKSSKPENFQYSFHTLATQTQKLLDQEGVTSFTLVGHSMGGVLATRYALMFPDQVKKLILVNPIGLEDYKVLTTYKSVDEAYQAELKTDANKIREYQKQSYYDGVWKPEYEPMLKPAIGWSEGPDKALIAKTSALTSDMVYTQPVVYEFKDLKVPTALIIGQRDRTAIGKAWALPENQKKMGLYPQLGRETAKKIPKSKLFEMKGVGHMPFVEDYETFMKIFKAQI